MFDSGIAKGIDQIIAGILGITVIGLILTKSSDVSTVVSSSADAFAKLLNVATFR
jgi:hypothetical protein